MQTMKYRAIIIAAITLFLAPTLCHGAEKIIPRLVEMVKDGKATMSANKKTLVNEKGEIVAKEIDEKSIKKPAAPTPEQMNPLAPQPPPVLTVCNYKCAIITRRCFADESGTAVCINTCDKQILVCE